MTTPRQKAERKVSVALVVSDLRSAIVAASALEHAGKNTATRDAYALAKAHTAAALGAIEALQSEARAKPNKSEIETFLTANRKRKP